MGTGGINFPSDLLLQNFVENRKTIGLEIKGIRYLRQRRNYVIVRNSLHPIDIY